MILRLTFDDAHQSTADAMSTGKATLSLEANTSRRPSMAKPTTVACFAP